MKALQNSLQNFEGYMASRLQIFRARDKIKMEKRLRTKWRKRNNENCAD